MSRTKMLGLAAAAAAAGSSVCAVAQPAPRAQTSEYSLQQQFDNASKAFDAGNWRLAVDLFAAISPRLRGTKARAVADIRQGYARLRLGNLRAGLPLLERGLAHLPSDVTLKADRSLATLALANAYETSHALNLAAEAYRNHLTLIDEEKERIGSYAGYIRTSMFDDPAAAIRAAEEMYILASGDPRSQAVALNLMGRAQLISGAKPLAIDTLRRALQLAGGLSQKIDALDAAIRADLGLVALLSGDQRMAHLYLASTGTAQDSGAYLPPPKGVGFHQCPRSASPTDMAVVEFAISPDGRIKDVRPIYSTRGAFFTDRMSGFAEYLRWEPSQVSRLRPFQAQMMRLELHCAKPAEGSDQLYRAAEPRNRWLNNLGIAEYADELVLTLEGLRRARVELANRERTYGKASPQLLPVLFALAKSPLVNFHETLQLWSRSETIARTANAPVAVSANLAVRQELLILKEEDQVLQRLTALSQIPTYAADAEAATYLDYEIGSNLGRIGNTAVEFLRRAAETKKLPETDLLRRAASLRMFYFERDRGVRSKYLAASGLKLSPCEMATLKMRPSGAARFPKEAARWGFEGWSILEFDVERTGRTKRIQPMISYPPLVFSSAATERVSSLRYEANNLVDPRLGCTGASTVVRFQLLPNSAD